MKLNKEKKYVKIVSKLPERILTVAIASTIMLSLPGCSIIENEYEKGLDAVYYEIKEDKITMDSIDDFEIVYFTDSNGKKDADIIWVAEYKSSTIIKIFIVRSVSSNEVLYEDYVTFPEIGFKFDEKKILEELFGNDFVRIPVTTVLRNVVGEKETYTVEDFAKVVTVIKEKYIPENRLY